MTMLENIELLELTDGQTIELHITKWERGTLTIYPPWKPEGKEIKVLRVWVPEAEKVTGPPYWDISSQTLTAQLLPELEKPTFRAMTFVITKYGVAPKARFSVAVR